MDMSMYMTQAISTGSSGLTAQTSGSIDQLKTDGTIDFQSMLQAMLNNTKSPTSEALNATNLLALNLQENGDANAFKQLDSTLESLLNQQLQDFGRNGDIFGDDTFVKLSQFSFGVTKNLISEYQLNGQNFLENDSEAKQSLASALMEEATKLQNGKAGLILQNIEEVRKTQDSQNELVIRAMAAGTPVGQFTVVNVSETNTPKNQFDGLGNVSMNTLNSVDGSQVTQTTENTEILEAQTEGFENLIEGSPKMVASVEKFLEEQGESKLASNAENGMQLGGDSKLDELMTHIEEPKDAITLQNLGEAPKSVQSFGKTKVDEDIHFEDKVSLTTTTQNERLASNEVAKTETPFRSSEIPQAYQQVKEKVLTTLEDGGKEFTMQLNPIGLGKINVKLVMTGQKLRIDIVAANPETQKLLISQAESLAKELGLAHINVEGVQIQQPAETNENAQVAATTGQDFDMSAGAGNQEGKQREQYAQHAGSSNRAMAGKELESLDEMAETYKMLRAEMGRLNYLA